MSLHTLLTKVGAKFNIDLNYFARGGTWLVIIQLITTLGTLLVSVLFANTLSESDFGVYRYIIGIGVLLSSFSLTGMDQAIFQASAKKNESFYTIGSKRSLIFGLGITGAALIGSLYYYLQGNIELGIGCLIIAVFQPLHNTFQLIFPFLQGSQRFKDSAVLQAAKTIFVTASSLGVLYLTQDILILVFTYLFSNTIANYVIHFFTRPKENLAHTNESQNTVFLKYASTTSIRNLISNIAYRIDTIIVFQQLGATSLAIYSIANIIPEHIKGSLKNLTTLLIPKYSNHQNILVTKASIVNRSFYIFALVLLLTAFYILCAPLLYSLLFPKYEEAIFLSQILSLSFPALMAYLPLSALQAHIQEKQLDQLNTYNSIATLLLTLVLTILYGLIGAILARVISRYVNLIISYYLIIEIKD